ncbi:MAG: hypothetical protein A2139_08015 [Desulfobacca sp. RBG_16_60_12]|nr:MAG: hypothetical protein A2139_08015 [Desulfobacca sp. RBG_16_60_12]
MRLTLETLRRIVEEELGSFQEGLSVNGSMGLGGHGEGFEQQNQGVTKRFPGEGPKVNGGRSQSQEMDSYDQPQYLEEPEGGAHLPDDMQENEMPWLGMQDPGGWDRQVATGLTNPGRDITDKDEEEGS